MHTLHTGRGIKWRSDHIFTAFSTWKSVDMENLARLIHTLTQEDVYIIYVGSFFTRPSGSDYVHTYECSWF